MGGDADDGSTALFAYGTLMPGRLRWPMVERAVCDVVMTTTPGQLWDTGHGYPAATFVGSTPIHGAVLRLRDDALDATWSLLDEVERGYRRVVVVTAEGASVRSYEWAGPLDRFALIPDGRWEGGDER